MTACRHGWRKRSSSALCIQQIFRLPCCMATAKGDCCASHAGVLWQLPSVQCGCSCDSGSTLAARRSGGALVAPPVGCDPSGRISGQESRRAGGWSVERRAAAGVSGWRGNAGPQRAARLWRVPLLLLDMQLTAPFSRTATPATAPVMLLPQLLWLRSFCVCGHHDIWDRSGGHLWTADAVALAAIAPNLGPLGRWTGTNRRTD